MKKNKINSGQRCPDRSRNNRHKAAIYTPKTDSGERISYPNNLFLQKGTAIVSKS